MTKVKRVEEKFFFPESTLETFALQTMIKEKLLLAQVDSKDKIKSI